MNQGLQSHGLQRIALTVVLSGVIWEGANRSILMLHPQIALQAEVGIQMLAIHLFCQEHSQNAPPAVQMARRAVWDQFCTERSSKKQILFGVNFP